MKFKLPMGVCIVIAVALVLFGLGYGTFSGFREDRQQVTQLLSGENGLLDALSYQGDYMRLQCRAIQGKGV